MESTLSERLDPQLRLIETMHRQSSVARLALHRNRMARSAEVLGWGFVGAAFDLAVQKAQQGALDRLRLTLDPFGDFSVEAGPIAASPAVWRVGLAQNRLSSGDPWLAVKSTRRPEYDLARASLPRDLDELILANERDEICDGTITTVFFDRGFGLRTPPLASGLLPGILRQETNAPEERLMISDLGAVRLWVGNALRGLFPAEFIAR